MNFIDKIAEITSKAAELNIDEVREMIEIPKPGMGDYAFPCFKLAKIFKKSPNIIAEDVAKKIEKTEFIDEIKVVNAYINFYVKKSIFVESVLKKSKYRKRGLYLF